MGGRYALLIGSGRYRDPVLSPLKTPAADVRNLASLLRDPAIGGFSDPVELKDVGVHQARREIERIFQKRQRDDLVLLYYSGHGLKDDEGHLHIALEDTEHDLLSSTAVDADFISDQMDGSRSRRQILILDCCYSGAFIAGTKSSGTEAAALAHAFRAGPRTVVNDGYGRVILTACDEVSPALDNTPFPESENSIFTHFLIEGLSGAADADDDGRISVDELYNYAYDRIVEFAPKQKPYRLGNQQGVLILAGAAPGAREHYSQSRAPTRAQSMNTSRRRYWFGSVAGSILAGASISLWLVSRESTSVSPATNYAPTQTTPPRPAIVASPLPVLHPAPDALETLKEPDASRTPPSNPMSPPHKTPRKPRPPTQAEEVRRDSRIEPAAPEQESLAPHPVPPEAPGGQTDTPIPNF